MSTSTLTRAARRELTAVRVAADIRYVRYAALFDQVGRKLDFMPDGLRGTTRRGVTLGKVRRGDTTAVSNVPVPVPTPKAHRTSLNPVDGKFLAVCSCGDAIQARPTGEAYAKGMATKHVNATSGATA